MSPKYRNTPDRPVGGGGAALDPGRAGPGAAGPQETTTEGSSTVKSSNNTKTFLTGRF